MGMLSGKPSKAVAIVLFLMQVCLCAAAGNQGNYYIRNYTAKEYGTSPQFWSLLKDSRGLLYASSVSGITEYDGSTWNYIDAQSVCSMARDSASGVIFAGLQDDIGYLSIDNKGKLNFKSLKNLLKKEDQVIGNVFYTFVTSDAVFFISNNKILKLKKGKFRVWNSEGKFHTAFQFGNHIYMRQKEMGLMEIQPEAIVPVPGGEFLSDSRLDFLLPFNSHTFIGGSRDLGLLRIRMNSPHPFSTARGITGSIEVEKIKSPVSDFLIDNQVYKGIVLSNGKFAIGTLLNGVMILDRDLETFSLINKKSGLQNDKVHYLMEDSRSILWMALDDGISSVEINSPFSYYNETGGLMGTTESVTEWNGQMYFATTQGVFRKKKGDNFFDKIPGIGLECWTVITFQIPGAKDLLLAGNKNGLFQIQEDASSPLFQEDIVYTMMQSRVYPNTLYLGLSGGLAVMEYNNGTWLNKGFIEGLEDEIRYINEDEKGNIWCSKKKLYHIARSSVLAMGNKVTKFKVSEVKLNKNETETEVVLSTGNNRIFIFYGKSVYEPVFSKTNNTHITPSTFFGPLLSYEASRDVSNCTYNNGKYWMSSARDVKSGVSSKEYSEFGYVSFSRSGKPYFRIYPFRRIPQDYIIKKFFVDEKGLVWMVGNFGALSYNPQSRFQYKSEPFNAYLRKIVSNGTDIFNGNNFKTGQSVFLNESIKIPISEQYPDNCPVLPYSRNNLNFYMGSGNLLLAENNQYSFKLEGNDRVWSEFQPRKEAIYTNLSEGTYTFKVRVRNVFFDTSQTYSYKFTILPPWYRTWWAYLSFVVAGTLLIAQIVRLFTLNLNRIINNQTRELRHQKSQIENKNKEITDSIFYARRIQEAIMPSRDFIEKAFLQSFILFKPKDIVSGDFYWASRKDEFRLIAAVDCTGHGVPGAFMSLLGNENLNEIVNEKGITSPEKILMHLRENIIRDLKQNEEGSSSKDGMDVSLIRWNPADYKLDFAGANNPLYIIRSATQPMLEGHLPVMTENGCHLFEIKGNKFPVGVFLNRELPAFTKHTFQLLPGDSLYIFSDGFADQFGGPDGKKFKYNQLKRMLLSMQSIPMSKQVSKLEEELQNWQGELEQVDDVLVIGIHV
jgi:serine phosphatase RsbU (regulator of sigma subunit)